MAHINRRYIDKHWLVFILRGILALILGWLALFWGGMTDIFSAISFVSVFLLLMGIIDSANALYNSTKKRGWVNSIIDAALDIVVALILLFLANGDLVFQLVVIAVYTFASGVIDIVHSFASTVDPTDRFIRIVAGVCGCIMGFVVLNAGNFEIMTFIRFFGSYMLIVGVCSLIYGVHNRSQNTEDRIARSEAAKKATKKITSKAAAKKSSKKSK